MSEVSNTTSARSKYGKMWRRSPARTEGQRRIVAAASWLRPCRSRTMRRRSRRSEGLSRARRSKGSEVIGMMNTRSAASSAPVPARSLGLSPWIPSTRSTSRAPSDTSGPPSGRLLPSRKS